MKVTADDIAKLIGLQLGLKKVGSEDDLREQLGAESLDVQNIIMAIEDKYRISVSDEEVVALRTVSDCYRLVKAKV